MIQTIPSQSRYKFENEWLTTRWHFSFDHYHDPANMNFGPLRVFNDDIVAPAGGFPLHGHREMEIVTYIIDGALEHQDNLGNTGVIYPGEIQRMSAGTGVRHSEFNPSRTDSTHLVQLWIEPNIRGLQPSWEQKKFSLAGRTDKLLPIALPAEPSANRAAQPHLPDGAVEIHQDAAIYTSLLAAGLPVTHTLGAGRRAYIFLIHGNLEINGKRLAAGDQARVSGERELQILGDTVPNGGAADFLLLDLP